MSEMVSYPFFTELARILNSGQARSVLLHGNVHDLFMDKVEAGYVPLLDFLVARCAVPGMVVLAYELNGPVRLMPGRTWDTIRSGWVAWRSGMDPDELVLQSLADHRRQGQREALEAAFDAAVADTAGRPTVALEFLRQLALCSRSRDARGRPFIPENLLILIEAADMLVPAGASGGVAGLNTADRQRVTILQDWFSDPGFMAGGDSAVLLSESRSLVHPRVTGLPSMLHVEVPAPDEAQRAAAIRWFRERGGAEAALWAGPDDLARASAGLSIHALRQLLIGAAHTGQAVTSRDVIAKVAQHIQAQLGEDVVEFKKPGHTLDDVVGFTRLKTFLREELIPRFRDTGPGALPGAAVAGPIGGGKTFIFEAVAAALDLPVLVLKNIRSQWFGQTDVTFERLRRVLLALGKVLIFVDEADTQFGGVGAEAHETERRLTGKVQQMMSDPALRGKVIWLLMTARIHRLSPDIRRPGRVGDLIIPVLDPPPGSDDRLALLRWTVESPLGRPATEEELAQLGEATTDYSAAAYASLRSHLKARAGEGALTFEQVQAVLHDHLLPAIGETRRYQTLQALVNCTRRSLLPDPDVDDQQRARWHEELRALEARGVG